MTVDEQVKYWIKAAENDLPVLENLFQGKHYLWCMFVGHLILEKIIKAHFVKDNKQNPPRTHDLLRLIEKTNLSINEDQKLFLDEINDYQLEARYPDYKFSIQTSLNFEKTKQKLENIKAIFEWLKSQLT
ncbi:MAG: HEPN domain-containing protein [Ignavibacteria bacterium]|nr:HEPN domain-containing protein [Ignavibacteria bacterium]